MAGKQEPTQEEPYVIDKFVGYYRANDGRLSGAPPGSLTDSSSNFLITEDQKIKKCFGVARLSSASATPMRTPFWWRRARGGAVCIVEANGALRSLDPGPPSGLWSALPGESTVTTDDSRDRISRFTTYGDWAFFTNGIENVKKIRRHDLKVYDLGLKPPTASELPTEYRTGTELTLGFGGLASGVYQYKFSFVYAMGGESNIGDETIRVEVPGDAELNLGDYRTGFVDLDDVDSPISLLRSFTRLIGFPTKADYANLRDDIVAINIYRTGANGSVYFYVGTVQRGYTSYLDVKSDAALGAPAFTDNDLPPVARFSTVHGDRLWLLGDLGEGAGDVASYSLPRAPDIFPALNRIPQTEWANAGKATGLESHAGTLYFFFERAIFRLVGEHPNYGITPVTTTFGLIAPHTLRIYEDQFIFLAKPGLMGLRGQAYTHLRSAVSNEMHDWPFQDFKHCAAVVVGDQYVLSMPGIEKSVNHDPSEMTRSFVVNLKNMMTGIPGFQFDIGSNDGPNDNPVVANYKETGGAESGVCSVGPFFKYLSGGNITAFNLDFNWLDLGHPDQEKQINKVEVTIVGHSTRNFRITLEDERGDSESFLPFTDYDYPRWNFDNFETTEYYVEPVPYTFEVFPKALNGRRFHLSLQYSFGNYDTRDIIIDKIAFYWRFGKRR